MEDKRRIRTHKKSRSGCRNCKLRRVKCDEGKPGCNKCASFGVVCSFESNLDLQLSATGASGREQQIIPLSTWQAIPPMIVCPVKRFSTGYELRGHEMDLVQTFERKDVLSSILLKGDIHHRDDMPGFLFEHPFLLHSVLALTLMYNRYLSNNITKMSMVEAYEMYSATSSFQRKLEQPILPSERDALWGAAAFLGISSFFYLEGDTIEEIWPLKLPSVMDLNWLKMSTGKKEVWRLIGSSPPGTHMELTADKTKSDSQVDIAEPAFELLPSEFIKLCGLGVTSSPGNNPFHSTAARLARSLAAGDEESPTQHFLELLIDMDVSYAALLQQKDPRALLLLAYWYTRVSPCQLWWMRRRVTLERQAICIYLERYHGHEPRIQRLLKMPGMRTC